jgi:hypothetical protein
MKNEYRRFGWDENQEQAKAGQIEAHYNKILRWACGKWVIFEAPSDRIRICFFDRQIRHLILQTDICVWCAGVPLDVQILAHWWCACILSIYRHTTY